jgi:hypothetical protein
MKADFDIGNLVYVILTIVFLAFGALGKKKKKPVPQVSEEPQDTDINPDSIKYQFQELFRELNPTAEILKEQEYSFTPKDTVEDGPPLDVVPEFSPEAVVDVIPPVDQPLDSNINYNDQAQSSLDTAGMDEGEPDFDYEKDHNSLVYNKITKEYDSVMMEHEMELEGIVEGFDPKTAFVYSEIFKRKDF